MKAEKYLKTNEVAKILGVNRKTIQRWAENGILVPAHTTGAGYNLYSPRQIADFCQSATNLLASATKCDKSPSIKNRTATNLQQAATRSEQKNEDSEPEKKSKSIRLIPAKMLVMPNDKLTKELFRRTPEEYHVLFEEGGEIVEVKNFPKVGEIITPYWLELIDEYTDKTPLTMFAKAILTACVSEWVIGNRHITVGVIFRHITGKPSGSNAQPSPAMKELILFFIRKMMCTILRVDMTEVCKYLNYNNGAPLILNAPILPCKYVEGVTVNGNKSETVIYFYDESPLLTIARVKNNQLLSVEPRLLSISKHSGSPRSISV
ncbi:MAG: MerR family transcriptional regulator, partial [Selenomonadaceae bacterium]|nr:MerR family transcriptional regulator [Selenomonadaceae bacterium]